MLSVLPDADELAPGLYRWVAYHEEWKQDVACAALDAGDRLVLVDPLAPAGLRKARQFWRALDTEAKRRQGIDVILTLHYHRRSSAAIVDRYRRRPGALLWSPQASVGRVGASVDRAFSAGDVLPGPIEAFASARDDEVVLWLPRQRALVSGDVLLGGVRKPYRVCPQSWLPSGVRRADVAAALAPLLELPVALLVPTHGPAVTEHAAEALAAALADGGP